MTTNKRSSTSASSVLSVFQSRQALKLSAVALLAIAASATQAQIVGSKHDLTAAGQSQVGATQTDEVCVFCHTPHGSAVGAPVPLWNKVLPDAGSYTRYSSLNLPTFDSQEAPVGSVSLACLSCHDGTQGMDVVLNRPGSGLYNALGAPIVGPGNEMGGVPVPNLGTDLSNDHPISMQYGGGGAIDTDPDGLFAGTLGDPDFNAPQKASVNGAPIWWVDTTGVGTAGTREKTDMLLYARADLGTVQPFVECGSCHDPHNASTEGPSSVAFLRTANTASRICTSCHTK